MIASLVNDIKAKDVLVKISDRTALVNLDFAYINLVLEKLRL